MKYVPSGPLHTAGLTVRTEMVLAGSTIGFMEIFHGPFIELDLATNVR